jgi:hypothetical protein
MIADPVPQIEAVETYHVVNRWWTKEPEYTHIVELRAPDGKLCQVAYSMKEQTWKLITD